MKKKETNLEEKVRILEDRIRQLEAQKNNWTFIPCHPQPIYNHPQNPFPWTNGPTC